MGVLAQRACIFAERMIRISLVILLKNNCRQAGISSGSLGVASFKYLRYLPLTCTSRAAAWSKRIGKPYIDGRGIREFVILGILRFGSSRIG